MSTLPIPCSECERLLDEQNEASLFLELANATLAATIPKDGEGWGTVELERWKVLDAEAARAYWLLRQAKQKKLEHRATHETESD